MQVTFDISAQDLKKVMDFLLKNEKKIANKTEDYGDFLVLFRLVIGRAPKK